MLPIFSICPWLIWSSLRLSIKPYLKNFLYVWMVTFVCFDVMFVDILQFFRLELLAPFASYHILTITIFVLGILEANKTMIYKLLCLANINSQRNWINALSADVMTDCCYLLQQSRRTRPRLPKTFEKLAKILHENDLTNACFCLHTFWPWLTFDRIWNSDVWYQKHSSKNRFIKCKYTNNRGILFFMQEHIYNRPLFSLHLILTSHGTDYDT